MVGGEPAVEGVGEVVGIKQPEEVVEGFVAGGAASGAAFGVGQEIEPGALFPGEELAVAVDGGEAGAPGQQTHADEGEQGGDGPAAIGGARIGDFAQDVAQAFDLGFFERQGALGGLEIAAGLVGGGQI